MNRTLKEATVNRYHYDSHEQIRAHLADFVTAYNFARRLKILKGLSPYEYICNAWTKEPGRFILDPGRPFIEHQIEIVNFQVALQRAVRDRTDVELISEMELASALPERSRRNQ